ncbi:SDR family NAD(P)-dependent oxidoreductase [Fructilactobacillus sp. Tb1]|uniref:SDR family NAD(P)-dependent oxidoreductase n=1 Tax=Fructilactobacillus sp. Tb1 TaxID=3422304 RepID=UPI003D29DA55
MKTVLITGANKGLGLALTETFANQNWHILMGVRNLERGQLAKNQLVKKGLKNLSLVQIDLSNPDSINDASKNITENYSNLSLLINNAGIPGKESIGYKTTLPDLHETMQVNFFGTYQLIKNLEPLLNKNHGTIVNITIPTSPNHLWNPLAYKTSKGAQNIMTSSLGIWFEKEDQHILIYDIHPGVMSTDLNNHITGPFVHPTETIAQKIADQILNHPHKNGDFVEIYKQISDNFFTRFLAKHFAPKN